MRHLARVLFRMLRHVAVRRQRAAAGELCGGQTRFRGGGLGDKIIEYCDTRGRWEVLDVHGGPCLAYERARVMLCCDARCLVHARMQVFSQRWVFRKMRGKQVAHETCFS